MGLCQSQVQERRLKKVWLTREQKKIQSMKEIQMKNDLSVTTGITLTSTKNDLEKTAEKIFKKFNISGDGYIKKQELLSFLRYANKRSGNHKKNEIFLTHELQNLFKSMKILNRTYLSKTEFVEYLSKFNINDL